MAYGLLAELVYIPMYISEICTRARQQASILYRKFYGHISSSTLLQLYLTFVQPHLEHAALVWYPHPTKPLGLTTEESTEICAQDVYEGLE